MAEGHVHPAAPLPLVELRARGAVSKQIQGGIEETNGFNPCTLAHQSVAWLRTGKKCHISKATVN